MGCFVDSRSAVANVEVLDIVDRPLLYAGAEHTTWVGAIEAFLHGRRRVPRLRLIHPMPPGYLDLVSAWALQSSGSPLFHRIESLHQELHSRGADILTLNAEGRTHESAAALSHLHSLRDSLLAELKLLLKRQ